MTIQTMEKLIYKGRKVDIVTEPLSSYFTTIKTKLSICPVSSGCWRGYVGTWLIEYDKLYLIGFQGYARIKPNIIEPVDMSYIFHGETKVFADWFTGEIIIPDGDLITNFQGRDITIYELGKLLDFKNGKLMGDRIVDNLLELSRMIL